MRKNCNIIFISAVVLIIICIVLDLFSWCTFFSDKINKFSTSSDGIIGSLFAILGFTLINIFGYYAIIVFGIIIFILTLIAYLLTFGKYKKKKIVAFKILNTISDFIWLIILFSHSIIFEVLRSLELKPSITISPIHFILTSIIIVLIICKIGYNIYLLYIKKGAFDNDKVLDEFEDIELSKPIETDYQISEEIDNDESNFN